MQPGPLDPYGLVSKAGAWYLVADRGGRPRLFRTNRISDAVVTAEPVRRRDGVELARVWEEQRREVEHRSSGLRVVVRVGRRRLDGDEWLTAELDYPVPAAVCQLLQFGTDVEVIFPPEAVREVALAGLRELYEEHMA
ncbi:helix-turn-helix transcriptional regulator [Streptomyces sp. NPDC059816]|uniref:helix-turn-helix transcriptional regulator n=1 Tax=Streptomyces sp. NPDC059816 TaxID=3346960 RepID=UPI00365A8311